MNQSRFVEIPSPPVWTTPVDLNLSPWLYERWARAVPYDHPVAWVRKVVVRDATVPGHRARSWGGLHVRDAMEDGYLLGHTLGAAVMREAR